MGEIIVILDDDMSPNKQCFNGVLAITARWPAHDLFTGPIRIVWPDVPLPTWARSGSLRGLAFSSFDLGDNDVVLDKWFLPSGNHFWFRSRALRPERRFVPLRLLSDAQFTTQLVNDGPSGVFGPDSVVGHRIQQHLLDRRVLLKRAKLLGIELPHLRLQFPDVFYQGRFVQDHPVLCWFVFAANLLRWTAILVADQCSFFSDERFIRSFHDLLGLMNSLESLREGHTIMKKHRRKDVACARDSVPPDKSI